ncbi:MAG TPA: DUF1559 domain-containing protein [Urbifossiella sp.]|nr:DUF1559 domain-containing protein [Urbifossiella sp.]
MSRATRRGFTLYELLVILAILAILAGLLLPSIRRVREAPIRMQCMSNLKQLMWALHTYESMEMPAPDSRPRGHFPSGCSGPGSTAEERLSWIVAVLPYLEEQDRYRQFDLKQGYAGNQSPGRARIRALLCPSQYSAERDWVTSYVALSGIGLDAAERSAGASGNGFMGYDRLTTFKMIEDGTSNTIALMEVRSDIGPWARGGPSTVRWSVAGSLGNDPTPFEVHSGVALVAMADGACLSLRASKGSNFAAGITIAGGDKFEPEQ